MGKRVFILISVVVVDSRSNIHPDWVQLAKDTVRKQRVECELVEIDNVGREKKIGECYNEGVKKAKYDLVLFLGDDDWLSEDYCSVLLQYALANPNYVQWATNMTAFNEEQKLYTNLVRMCTGMWKKDYLLKYPFNEELVRGIDREYIQEMQKRGDLGYLINHHYGYYYRKHDDYSSSGKISFKEDDNTDIYVLTSSTNFIDPLVARWKKNNEVYVTTGEFNPLMADNAKIIWCEWLRNPAIDVAKYVCNAYKILRLHAYEAFSPLIYYVDFSKFDTVIFIAEHIKDYVESKIGKFPNAVVIPVGIDVKGYTLRENEWNKKIAYAGEISKKKGAGELILLAKSLPEYEFHIAGKFNEDDTAEYFIENKSDNIFAYPYSYDLNSWLQDYTFFINTSLREGNPITVLQAMACGLKPLVRDWVGAKQIYNGNTFGSLQELKGLLTAPYKPEKYRQFVTENYNLKDTYKEIEKIMGKELELELQD